MSIPSLTSRIEAILYLKGRPISLSELAELARDEPDQVRTAIAMLTTSYAQRDTALEVWSSRVATACSYALPWPTWSRTCFR